MKTIPLSKGKVAVVDDCDFEWLNQWKWYCHMGYAARTVNSQPKRRVFMHREILSEMVGEFKVGDHINRAPLDNRRTNLRPSDALANMCNKNKYKNNTSGFVGVCWNKKLKRWRAVISFNGRRLHLGYFDDPKDASAAYETKKIERTTLALSLVGSGS
jgi:hypothetical protein